MKRVLFILSCVVLTTSCKNNTAETTAETPAAVAETNEAIVKDGLKSAIYESEMVMPGGMGTSNSRVIFDDFGKKTLTEIITVMSFGGKGMNTTAKTLVVDGYAYTWSNTSKTGTKIKVDDSRVDPKNVDVSKLSDEMKAKLNYKDEGTETIDGKECKVGSYSIEQMKGKVWVWKQIPVKMEMSIGGNTIISNLKNLQENPSIPSGTFDVPADIEFKEMSMPAIATN